uniref:Uncharacterized protein n=1 Tax=Parascaris equorum TaxID=6256 RepID=A0A914RUG7_PAREQ
MFGVKNLLKYYSARADSSSNDNAITETKSHRAHSFKEFINDQKKAINVIRRKGGIEKLDPNGSSASLRNRARGKERLVMIKGRDRRREIRQSSIPLKVVHLRETLFK